ncbi:hypothetical protein LTR73_009195 [Friedmanniomyces endolithicus]|nr:hypothetical protein LTR73_009195 [Friedmanniomyces endolithicus]
MFLRQQPTPGAEDTYNDGHEHAEGELCRHDHEHDDRGPFLTKHIPMQYNPQCGLPPGSQPQPANDPDQTSTKFGYRHRPDVKCRTQANEASMDQLQTGLASLTQADQQAISHVWSLFSAAPAKHRNLMLQGFSPSAAFRSCPSYR